MAVVDASILIGLYSKVDPHHASCRAWFAGLQPRAGSIITPAIAASETCSGLSRGSANPALARAVLKELLAEDLVSLVPVDKRLAALGARIAIEQRIRGCDALYVALAQRTDARLITLDRQQAARAAGLIEVELLLPSRNLDSP
jgi:predicted nucleic acid-binding protein